MLKSALPKLQSDIEKILIDSLYEAQMSVFKANGTEPVIDTYCNTTLQESAMNYAKKAAEKASQPLAEAIYNFAMEIRKAALKSGYQPLIIDGIKKVINGTTNLQELNNKLAIY